MDLGTVEFKTVKFKELGTGEFFIRRSQLSLGGVILYKKTAAGYLPVMSEPVDPEEDVIRVLVLPPVILS